MPSKKGNRRELVELMIVLGINASYLIILGFSVGYLTENDMQVITVNGAPFAIYDVLISLALVIPTLSTLILILLRRARKNDLDLGSIAKGRAARPRRR